MAIRLLLPSVSTQSAYPRIPHTCRKGSQYGFIKQQNMQTRSQPQLCKITIFNFFLKIDAREEKGKGKERNNDRVGGREGSRGESNRQK